MLQLQSRRLTLIPLNLQQLQLLSEGRNAFEKKMGFAISNLELSDEGFLGMFDEALHGFMIPNVSAHETDFEWYTHWLIMESSSNLCIGGIGASGLPDEKGQVMIGYFIDRKFEGLGYATEAVECFTQWLLKSPATRTIIADTPINHVASQKVLGKNGFNLLGEVEEGFRWQLIAAGR